MDETNVNYRENANVHVPGACCSKDNCDSERVQITNGKLIPQEYAPSNGSYRWQSCADPSSENFDRRFCHSYGRNQQNGIELFFERVDKIKDIHIKNRKYCCKERLGGKEEMFELYFQNETSNGWQSCGDMPAKRDMEGVEKFMNIHLKIRVLKVIVCMIRFWEWKNL
jgi:hypothetical protein